MPATSPNRAGSPAVRFGLSTLGIALLGATVGYLTGSTGPDSTVLAALLPSILSILGGGAAAAILVRKTRIRNDLMLAGGTALIIFSLSLAFATQLGTDHRNVSDKANYIAAQQTRYDRLWQDLKDHHRRLEECFNVEIKLNDNRQKFGLPPLTHDQICPTHIGTTPTPPRPD